MKGDFVEPSDELVEKLCARLGAEAKQAGYNLNSDADFVRGLVKGLLVNEKRYGYRACPCRLATGDKAEDLDIICPCDYRDADLTDFGACYCALYVSKAVLAGKQELAPIPERRLPEEERKRLDGRRKSEGRVSRKGYLQGSFPALLACLEMYRLRLPLCPGCSSRGLPHM